MLELMALVEQCAPTVAPQTMAAVVQVESSFNPYAIGVVGGRLARQPKSLDEAVATAQSLEAQGFNFSVGIAQVNRYNLPKYSLSYARAFDPCENLRAGSKILEECYGRAHARMPGKEQEALQAAFSCYYSGNFTRGFRPDKAGDPSYVQKVLASAADQTKAIPVVPAIGNGQRAAAKQPADAQAAVPLTVEAVQTPPSVVEPADHSSVLVDLAPRKVEDAPEPPQADAATEDGPVPLKPVQAGDSSISGKTTTEDVTIF
ncbi:transglycosylase SLT domain-containing protein [Rhizobium sp. TRM95111]|uniref:transglycosylase SLT domain-containing protein n=1 Tax=Rhizobium alarense TaxID=2846851 RepID=UPI001F394E73|nr:transglycosylase SLT domain-containing protein [Rhizobium alarense]MCF3642941.1 transglycosylase SLT domain-containing protein [Rhizobium alarense]